MTRPPQALAAAIAALEPIGLDELVAAAALQTRIDRKYLLPVEDVGLLVAGLGVGARALEIDGSRSFAYESVYFDTDELTSYHLTARRRRRRFKLRTRTYLDSGQCWLEVKSRDGHGRTVKRRLAYALDDRATLTTSGRAFADRELAAASVPMPAATSLTPTLATRYRRSTLYLPATGSRITIDTGLGWDLDSGPSIDLPGFAVVETKTGSAASSFDRLLWSNGYRPTSISKYATGLAALRPDLPATRWHRLLRRQFDGTGTTGTTSTPTTTTSTDSSTETWSPR